MDRRRKSIILSWCAAIVLTTATARAGDRVAPADEYFGSLKMSPLEVTNRISDAERGRATLDGLINTQDAIEDWTQKYPADPWIVPRELRIVQLFLGLHSQDGDAEARHCWDFLRLHFPDAEPESAGSQAK